MWYLRSLRADSGVAGRGGGEKWCFLNGVGEGVIFV